MVKPSFALEHCNEFSLIQKKSESESEEFRAKSDMNQSLNQY